MNDNLQPVIQRLDILINLITIGLISDKNQREQLALLSKAGFPPKEIAKMLGTTSNTISVELSKLRKAKKKRKKTNS